MKDLRKYAEHECYKSPYYLELCEKCPRFRHLLPDHPEPPVKLLPCPFCGGYGIPWFTCNAYYGTPGFFIRCNGCGAKTFPTGWGDRAIYPPEDVHEVTEQEALAIACRTWNRREGGVNHERP